MENNKPENLLQKVGHLIEEKPQPEAEKKEESSPAPEVTSPKTRNKALIIYISLLFSVAFLLVLVSLIIQQRNSDKTITQLNQNASSALTHAEQLQNDNRQLQQENMELLQKNANLEDQIDDLNAQIKAEQDAAAVTAEEKAQVEADLAAAKEAVQTAKDDIAKMQETYELLLRTESALKQGLTKDFEEAMAMLEEVKDYLGESALAIYEELATHLPNINE